MSIDLNPYSCEIPGNLFTGYRGMRASMLAGIRNRRSYAVIGGHRCGKTSLLLQLKQDLEELKDDHFRLLPVMINAKELMPRSEYEFFAALWTLVAAELGVETLRPDEAGKFDANFFGMGRIAPRLEEKYGPNWLVVFLIDELDAAACTLADKRFFQLLRQVLMDQPHGRHFRLIATGGSGMAPLTGEGSILSLEPKYLGPLTDIETDGLIAHGFVLTSEQCLRIRELTGRHSYITQALLGGLWETQEEDWSADRVQRAVQKVTRDRFGSFRRWIAGFGEHGCAVYGTLANAGRTLRREEIQARLRLGLKLSEALDVLCYHGAIEEDTNGVRVCGLIFRDWFRTNFEIELPALPKEIVEDRSKSVFVVHGRNDRLRVAMYTFLRELGLHPLEWTEIKELTKGLNPYIGDILEMGFSKAQAVVVMLTGDDEARLRAEFQRPHDTVDEREMRPQPRPNVLFEAGVAMAKFPEATVLVQIGEIRSMSDILGRHLLRMDGSLAARTELARALAKAGCAVDMDSNDRWQTAGKFEAPRYTTGQHS
jgi:predicted nucleotide-binding protein